MPLVWLYTDITPTMVTYMDELFPTADYGNSVHLKVRGYSDGKADYGQRGLLNIDLSGLPAAVGADEIASISYLRLYCHTFDGAAWIDAYILTETGWVEGDEPASSGADWNTYDNVNAWTGGGAQGDFGNPRGQAWLAGTGWLVIWGDIATQQVIYGWTDMLRDAENGDGTLYLFLETPLETENHGGQFYSDDNATLKPLARIYHGYNPEAAVMY